MHARFTWGLLLGEKKTHNIKRGATRGNCATSHYSEALASVTGALRQA